MKVRLRTTAAGPSFVASAGDVIDLPAVVAQALIDGGYAESVPPSISPPDVETAAIGAPEAAIARRRGRPRRAGQGTR